MIACAAGRAAAWQAFYAGGVETLTFLFTDIEGSTALLGRLGDDLYARVLAGHHALIRSALAAYLRCRRQFRRCHLGGTKYSRVIGPSMG